MVTDLVEVKRKLDEAVACVMALGWKLRPDFTADVDSKFCCPLGAVWVCAHPALQNELSNDQILDLEGYDSILGWAAKRVEMRGEGEVALFVRAFDGLTRSKKPITLLGRSYRRQVAKGS